MKINFGVGMDNETDLFMNSEIALNGISTGSTLIDEAGNVVSFLGFETLPYGGVVITRSGESEY